MHYQVQMKVKLAIMLWTVEARSGFIRRGELLWVPARQELLPHSLHMQDQLEVSGCIVDDLEVSEVLDVAQRDALVVGLRPICFYIGKDDA